MTSRLDFQPTRTDADRLRPAFKLLGDRHPQVADRRLWRSLDVTVSLARDAARYHQWQRIRRVNVAVAHAAAVADERVIEDAAVTVGRRRQLLDELGKLLHVEVIQP